MNILCVIDSLCSGGAQRQLVELAIGLNKKGHKVSFLVYHEDRYYYSVLKNVNIKIVYINEPRYLNRLLKMRSYIRKGKFDSVISFLQAANFICEISGFPFKKWKLIVGERSANPKISKSIKLRIYRWFHFFADVVVFNSYSNMKIVKKINPLLSNKKCKVIYNAIDTKKWKPLNEFYYKKKSEFRIVIGASHRYLKNLNGLIEAVNMLKNKDKEKIKIDWYGDIIDNSFLKMKNKINFYKLNYVFNFYPATHQIIDKIQNADAVGLFSFYEGLPNIICEAMSCGKPVICSKVSDLSFFLSYEPDLLVNPNDFNSIKKGLSFLLNMNNDKLLNIGKKNRQIAISNFEKNKIINKYLNLID